jgi:hypothetical protein
VEGWGAPRLGKREKTARLRPPSFCLRPTHHGRPGVGDLGVLHKAVFGLGRDRLDGGLGNALKQKERSEGEGREGEGR